MQDVNEKQKTADSLNTNIKLRAFSKSCCKGVKELDNRMQCHCRDVEALLNFGARLSLSRPIRRYVFLTSFKLLKLRIIPTINCASRKNLSHSIHSQCLGDNQGRLQTCGWSVLDTPWLIRANCRFNQTTLIDTTPLPAEIPPVQEIGASSAPLLSASFFIGARCKPYNDDFMQCKSQNPGKGETECLKEGRRVTRCAKSVWVAVLFGDTTSIYFKIGSWRDSRWFLWSTRIEDVNKHCLEEFRKHWTCLDNNNQQLWQCRPAEWKLNKCVFDNLVSCDTHGLPSRSIDYHYRKLRKSFRIHPRARHQSILRPDK